MSQPTDNPQETPQPKQGGDIVIPDIDALPIHPIVQTLASRESWVRVIFYSKAPPTKAEIDRTIELLCMIRNGWDD